MDLKKAAMINACSKGFIIVIQLISAGILARLLSPTDYGTFAVIVVFVNFFMVISDIGFISAVIQKKNLSEDDLSHIFSVTVYLGLILAVVFIGVSRILVIVYDSPVYFHMGLQLGISVLFSSMNAVPEAILMRQKRFLMSALRNISTRLMAGILAIILAIGGFHVYALIWQTVFATVLTFVINAYVTKVHFKLIPNFNPVRSLLRFSIFQTLFDVVNFFSRNVDNLIAGKVFGKEKLGLYNKAYTLTLYPINNLAGVVSPVLHPILSDYQSDTETLYRKLMPVIRLFGVVAAFIAPFCFFEGRELILILFGNQWLESVRCFQFLAFSLYAQMLNQCISAGFQSLGKTKLMFINGLINTSITIVAILIGIFHCGDIYGLALCVSVAYILRFFIAYFILLRYGFEKSYFSFIREVFPEIGMLLVMFGASVFIHLSIENIYLSFVVKGGIMTGLYALLLFVSGDWKLIRDVLFSSKRGETA